MYVTSTFGDAARHGLVLELCIVEYCMEDLQLYEGHFGFSVFVSRLFVVPCGVLLVCHPRSLWPLAILFLEVHTSF